MTPSVSVDAVMPPSLLMSVRMSSPQSTRPTPTTTAVQRSRSSPSLTSWRTPTPPPPWTRAGTLDSAASRSHWTAASAAPRCLPATATRTWTTSWVQTDFLFPGPSVPTSTRPWATIPASARAAWTATPAATRGSACA